MDYQAYLREAEGRLDDVERALDRLADGTYGTCEVCSSAISDAELEASPATRWCGEHRPPEADVPAEPDTRAGADVPADLSAPA